MGKKILIIDDEQDFIKMLELRIKSAGYEVVTACDGMDGLEKARAEKPDLIILDVMLPKMNGDEVCRMLKFDTNYRKIPIIILTARAQKKDEVRAMEAGADAYLQKPFEPNILLDKIRDLLQQ
jgi:DNA-binding response OmpR family regulator